MQTLFNIITRVGPIYWFTNRFTRWWLRLWIGGWYGNRCEEFQDGCGCCEAWKAFDKLFETIN